MMAAPMMDVMAAPIFRSPTHRRQWGLLLPVLATEEALVGAARPSAAAMGRSREHRLRRMDPRRDGAEQRRQLGRWMGRVGVGRQLAMAAAKP
jgi:hypothetical protein